MRLILTPGAKEDIRAAATYYEGERKGLGTELRDEIEVFLALIRTQPRMFVAIHPRVRRAPLRRFPYSIFYEVRPDSVHVVAILHNARDPELWKRRRGTYRG